MAENKKTPPDTAPEGWAYAWWSETAREHMGVDGRLWPTAEFEDGKRSEYAFMSDGPECPAPGWGDTQFMGLIKRNTVQVAPGAISAPRPLRRGDPERFL